MILDPVTMDFCHHCLYGLGSPEAYENLLFEIIKGPLPINDCKYFLASASSRFFDDMPHLSFANVKRAGQIINKAG